MSFANNVPYIYKVYIPCSYYVDIVALRICIMPVKLYIYLYYCICICSCISSGKQRINQSIKTVITFYLVFVSFIDTSDYNGAHGDLINTYIHIHIQPPQILHIIEIKK